MNRRFFLGVAAALPLAKLAPPAALLNTTERLLPTAVWLPEEVVTLSVKEEIALGHAITRKAIDDNLRRALFPPVVLAEADDG